MREILDTLEAIVDHMIANEGRLTMGDVLRPVFRMMKRQGRRWLRREDGEELASMDVDELIGIKLLIGIVRGRLN